MLRRVFIDLLEVVNFRTALPASLTFRSTRFARTHDIARVKPTGTSITV
jgi:hypothetical protein